MPNSLSGIVMRIQSKSHSNLHGGMALFWYPWHDIVKIFRLGDYVEVVGGDFLGRHGFVQDVSDDIFIEVMEGHYSQGCRVCESARRLFCMLRPCQDMQVHCNSARLIPPPTMSNIFAISPHKIAQ